MPPLPPELERQGLRVSPSTRQSSSLASEMEKLGLDPAELGPAFLRYAEYLDVEDWPANPVSLPDLKPCIEELRDYADHMGSLEPSIDAGRDKLIPKYKLIGRMIQRLDLNQPSQLMEVLEQFQEFEKGDLVQRNWPGKGEQALAELDRWNVFVRDYAIPLTQVMREHRYESVMRAIRPARDVYARLRRERNGLCYQELLLLATDLLRDKPEVRRYFRERFTHLLVDEFQDTDPVQAEVMLLLTADDCHETDWQQCRPVPGSLFVVGDPKQSIYRFRRADILTYSKVRSIIEQVGGVVVPLTANFRSVKPVVEWVNSCFSDVFPSRADDYSPSDRPLEVGRAGTNDRESAIQCLRVPSTIRYNDPVARYEADLIARTIRQAIDDKWVVSRTDDERKLGVPDHAQAGDFLIVARTKARLTTYARQLQQYGIPHAVTGGRVLNEVPELELLHTCLAAVARPDDPVALLAVLRSELFGVADTVLYDFRRQGGQFSYHAAIPPDLPENDAAVLQDAFDRLKTYSGWLRRMPMAAAVEKTAADLGLIARACAAENGDAHAGSLLKVIELLRSNQGHLTVSDYVDALGQFVDQTEQHDGVPVRPAAEMPVRVMNLHQCKGLEAPFVFLVDPSGESDHDIDVHIDRSGAKPRGYLPIYGRKRSEWGRPPLLAQPPGWSQLAMEEQRFLDAETNRLLYVAATRARVGLVISQRTGKSNDKNPWRLFDGYLQGAKDFADRGPVAVKPSIDVKIAPKTWKKELATIEKRWRTVVEPTYAVQAIKESVIEGGPKPHGAEKGGAEWGEVLHTLLEVAMKPPDADLYSLAMSALEKAELPVTLVDSVITTVEQVSTSNLWRRAQNAQCCLTEVPLAMPVPVSKADSGLPTVLRGVIDLVFQEVKGWVIVDYKSERVDASDIPALVIYYKPQIEAYADVWTKIVGQPVSERGLLFTHTGDYCTV